MLFKKIKEFVLYSGASAVALGIDLIVFAILTNIVFVKIDDRLSILLSTIIARIISGFVNFLLSKQVFKSKNLKKTAILKYFALGAIQLLSSAGLVILIRKIITISKTVIKFVVDILLYIVFYELQVRLVFRNKKVAQN